MFIPSMTKKGSLIEIKNVSISSKNILKSVFVTRKMAVHNCNQNFTQKNKEVFEVICDTRKSVNNFKRQIFSYVDKLNNTKQNCSRYTQCHSGSK